MPVDPINHSKEKSTQEYFKSFWDKMMKANGYNSFSLVDLNGGQIIFVNKSKKNSGVDLGYESYTE